MAGGKAKFCRSLVAAQAILVWGLGETDIDKYIEEGSLGEEKTRMPYSADAMRQIAESGKWTG